MSGALPQHRGGNTLGDVEEAGEIGGDLCVEVLGRVVREGLGDEDAGIVDERVDPPEAGQRLLDDALGGGGIANVAGDRENIRIAALLDRARRRHDAIIAIAIGLDEHSTDTLGGARYDGDLLLIAHDWLHDFSSLISGWR